MASLNKVQLIGNLGKDPESRTLQDGTAVCSFSIATTEVWKDKQGQKQERTEWHNIVMFRALAEIAEKYLSKGSSVYVEGKIKSEKYIDRENVERTAYKIIADSMVMLSSNKAATTPQNQQAPAASAKPPIATAKSQYYIAGADEADNDLPF